MKRGTWFAIAGVTAALAAFAAAYGWNASQLAQAHAREAVKLEVAGLTFAAYAPQKVVYHVKTSGGWFEGNYRDVLGSLTNHIAAVGKDKADLRVVLQGEGLGLLTDAMTNETLRQSIDKLRAQGVRFEVCRNSMVARGIGFERLYGVKTEDVVQAGVAEISALEGQGFVYVRF